MNPLHDTLIRFSPGCQSCQRGTWLCVYLTYLCSARCSFCPAPAKNQDRISSAFGSEPETVLKWLDKTCFEGISFSGGDSFLVFDRFVNWLNLFKKHHPDIYYWAYTNGLDCQPEQFDLLAKAGLDELRFNIAASGYDNAVVLTRVKEACRFFRHVAIEIPSIPVDYTKLINVIPLLEDMGVEYLNLHEFILMPKDSAAYGVAAGTFILNKIEKIRYHAYSAINSDKIISHCRQKHPRLIINNCTLRQKENQLLQRRLKMGELLKNEYESLTAEGLLKVTINISNQHILNRLNTKENLPENPAAWDAFIMEMSKIQDNDQPLAVYEFLFLPPLGIGEPRRLLSSRRVLQCLT